MSTSPMIDEYGDGSLSASNTRTYLTQILNDVSTRKDRLIIERDNQPVAAIVPIEIYTRWRVDWDRGFELLAEASARANLSEMEADALATETVAALRATWCP